VDPHQTAEEFLSLFGERVKPAGWSVTMGQSRAAGLVMFGCGKCPGNKRQRDCAEPLHVFLP